MASNTYALSILPEIYNLYRLHLKDFDNALSNFIARSLFISFAEEFVRAISNKNQDSLGG